MPHTSSTSNSCCAPLVGAFVTTGQLGLSSPPPTSQCRCHTQAAPAILVVVPALGTDCAPLVGAAPTPHTGSTGTKASALTGHCVPVAGAFGHSPIDSADASSAGARRSRGAIIRNNAKTAEQEDHELCLAVVALAGIDRAAFGVVRCRNHAVMTGQPGMSPLPPTSRQQQTARHRRAKKCPGRALHQRKR